nr:hypothetical protein [Tanacetum cinerariifolium]
MSWFSRCSWCEGPFNGRNCPSCSIVGSVNEFVHDPNPLPYDNTPDFSYQPPQHHVDTYLCELYGNDSHYGHDCPPRFLLVYEPELCYNQNFSDNHYPQNSPSFSQLCCENCGGPHEIFQCQPMNQNFYNFNSFGFDQFQPPQYPIVHQPPQETSTEILQARENLMESIQVFLKNYDQIPSEEKCIALLLAEEKFFKVKQTLEEEQNQPEIVQELLLQLIHDLQLLNEIQPKQAEEKGINKQARKKQEETSIAELLAEEKVARNNSLFQDHNSSQFFIYLDGDDDDDDYDKESIILQIRILLKLLRLMRSPLLLPSYQLRIPTSLS